MKREAAAGGVMDNPKELDPISKIRRILFLLGMTQKELADKARINRFGLSIILNYHRHRHPIARTRAKIAKALGLTVEELWGEPQLITYKTGKRGFKVSPTTLERVKMVRKLIREGWTYQAIGDLLGVSKQRAHQMFKKGIPEGER